MSFDFNPIGNNFSSIQASSKTTEGGAGNTGYFKREEEEEEKTLSFKKDYPNDSFEHIELEDIEEKEEGFFDFLKKLYVRFLARIKYELKKLKSKNGLKK